MDIDTKDKTNDLVNESNLIIPFHFDGKFGDFNKFVNAQGFQKPKNKEKSDFTWVKDPRRVYRYLAAHIDELIDNENPDSICLSYHLVDTNRLRIGLPTQQEKISMESRIMKGEGKSETFTFYLGEVSMFIFKTGLGFIVLNVKHEARETLASIENKAFSLTRFYMKETEGLAKISELDFIYHKINPENGKKTKYVFSLSNSLNQLLQIKKTPGDKIKLFPSSNKNECNIYHRIQVPQALEEEELQANLYCLRRAFHSSFYRNKEDSMIDNATDFIYQTQHNNYFSFCQRGLVCLYYPTINSDVFTGHFTNNVRTDYFFIYLFLLHERQALFYFNSIILQSKKQSGNLVKMKKMLIEFRINYSYKVISDEASYQNFYSQLYKAFSLDELNVDIQDIIDRATEHQESVHEKGTNTALAVLALFSIFSAFESGLAIVDRVKSTTPLTWEHYVFAAVIVLMVMISFGIFFGIKKRR